MTAAERLRPTYAEYLSAELASEERHAFHAGEIFDMAGGSTVHALLSAAIVRRVDAVLDGRPCAVAGSDQRIHIDDANVTYADAVVLCPPLRRPAGDAHAVTNPSGVIEVLSPSTEAWDRGGKFALYGTLSSLRHYVLVAQDCWRVTHYRREDDGTWRMSVHGPGDTIVLDSLDVRFGVDELYAKVESFGGPSREDAPRPPRAMER
jgi:Uma2 family endonuclease